MNREDITRMALDAGFCHDINNGIYLCAPMHIERFAALVAAAEREACAKVCEELTFSKAGPSVEARRQRLLCADAIRARGQE